MTAIDYSSGSRIVNEGTHVVYAKAAWGDSWTAQPNLKALECQWNAAPNMNTAVLRWDMGDVILPGDSSPTTLAAWAGRGQFIRIDWTCDNASILRWIGFVDASSWPTEAFGSQTIVCYGLEQSLAKTPISDAVWRDIDAASMDDPKPGLARRSAYPLTFNAPDGRRSKEVAEDGEDYYAFAAHTDEDKQTWSTREIVRYLMTYHLPTNTYGVSTIPWSVDQITQLPDWDAPYVETRNRTVWDILVELISADKQLGFTVGSDGSTCYLRCFTHLASLLTIGSNTIAANPNQHTLVFAPDALTNADLSDVGGGYDQVIVRGARRKTICTLRHGSEFINDWSSSLESQYEVGASAEGGYSALSADEKRQRNDSVRGRPLLSTVFRRFKIDPDWDWQIDATNIFSDNDYPYSVRILDRLPIKAGVSWDGTLDAANFDREGEGRAMLVYWEDPTSTMNYVDNAALAQISPLLEDVEVDFAVRPRVTDRMIEMIVDGGPQHLIASSDFTPLSGDMAAQLDFTTAAMTVCIEEDRFCEGVYPTTPATADVIRRLVIDLGEAYEQIRVHADTVTEITGFDGDELLSDGGDLVDDSPQLAALAQVIAQSVLLTRKTVAWSSLRKISSIAVGDLITTAEGVSVVAPVTGIHMRGSVGINRPAGAVQQSFEVYRGLMDPLAVVRRLGGGAPGTQLSIPRPMTAAQVRGQRMAAKKR